MPEGIEIRELGRTDWPFIEELFGARGACGGCWCMAWRSPYRGAEYRKRQGEPNRQDFKNFVETGRAHGCLAFAGSRPVAWCSVGPRATFPALQRSRVLKSEWDEKTWSITCLFVLRGVRGRGVATALARAAVELARKRGAQRVEAYPVNPAANGEPLPGPFAWTGVPAIYERIGFTRQRTKYSRAVYTLAVA